MPTSNRASRRLADRVHARLIEQGVSLVRWDDPLLDAVAIEQGLMGHPDDRLRAVATAMERRPDLFGKSLRAIPSTGSRGCGRPSQRQFRVLA